MGADALGSSFLLHSKLLHLPKQNISLFRFDLLTKRFINLDRSLVVLVAQYANKYGLSQLQQLIAQIDGVLDKVDRIEQIFGSINGFLSFLSDFIPLLRILNGTMQVVLAAQVFPVASGTLTVRAGDALKYVKSKIKEIDALVKLSRAVSIPVFETTDAIQDDLIPLKNKLLEILGEVRARCFYLDSVLIDKLKELELSMTQNPSTGGGIGGPNGTGVDITTEDLVNVLSNQFEPEDILDNLENSNKTKCIP